MPERAVNAPTVPFVIRMSAIDNAIWSVAVTFAPTWNTPPVLVDVDAEPVGRKLERSEPALANVSLPVLAVLFRTNSTDHAPDPRSCTLTVTPPVKPAPSAALTSPCSSVCSEAAVLYVPAVTVTVTDVLVPPESTTRSNVVEVAPTVRPEPTPVTTLVARASCAPKVPLRSFWVPNEVVPAMRS